MDSLSVKEDAAYAWVERALALEFEWQLLCLLVLTFLLWWLLV
jgi:hypothetical protein